MKKRYTRIGAWMMTFLLIFLSITGEAVRAQTDAEDGTLKYTEVTVTEQTDTYTFVPEDDGTWDNDALFAAYAQMVLSGSRKVSPLTDYSSYFSGDEQAIYQLFQSMIEEVSSQGGTAAVSYTFDSFTVNGTYSDSAAFEEAVNEKISEMGSTAETFLSKALYCLLAEYPYELYWFDKTVGVAYGFSYTESVTSYGGEYTGIVTPVFNCYFYVAEDYAEEGTDGESGGSYVVSASKASAASSAASAAQDVVAAYAGCSDYEKLTAYQEYICSAVFYNDEAASSDYDGGYGDPWQLIYVFDGDSDTNVVCEGYAKAFQYLCDLSDFDSEIICCLVSGTLSGTGASGAHMWNVVSVDGVSYHVDVTLSDEGSVGSDGELFLAGADSGSVSEGYTFVVNGNDISYIYDDNTLMVYDTDVLTLGSEDMTADTQSSDDTADDTTDDTTDDEEGSDDASDDITDDDTQSSDDASDDDADNDESSDGTSDDSADGTAEDEESGSDASDDTTEDGSDDTDDADAQDDAGCEEDDDADDDDDESGDDASGDDAEDGQSSDDASDDTSDLTDSVTITGISGSNRYETMALVASEAFENSQYAVIATGTNFPDALSAASLAGVLNAPIILISENRTEAALQTLSDLGVTDAYIIGGTSAVSSSVQTLVEDMGISVTRISGSNRYQTAIAIADKANTFSGGSDTCIVASGTSFPDALSGSPYSWWAGAPIYLAKQDGSLNEETIAAIEEGGYENIIILGGESAVSASSYQMLSTLGTVTRLGGSNRYETSKLVAEWSAQQGMSYDGAVIATGTSFPDALSGSALCGVNGSVLLLCAAAAEKSSALFDALEENAQEISQVYILGGTSAVSEEIRGKIYAALE